MSPCFYADVLLLCLRSDQIRRCCALGSKISFVMSYSLGFPEVVCRGKLLKCFRGTSTSIDSLIAGAGFDPRQSYAPFSAAIPLQLRVVRCLIRTANTQSMLHSSGHRHRHYRVLRTLHASAMSYCPLVSESFSPWAPYSSLWSKAKEDNSPEMQSSHKGAQSTCQAD